MKKIINFILPIFTSIIEILNLMDWDKIFDDFKWTLKLYSLTLVIPIALSFLNISFCGFLGLESQFGFWGNFKIIWIDYYFTGHLFGIIAYKYHLLLLFISYVVTRLS